MNEFLDFRKMITPTIIKIIFWIGVGASLLSGVILMIAGAAASAASSQSGGSGIGLPGPVLVFLGLLQIVFGPLLVRISCELTILFFRIYETLTEIRDAGAGKALTFAPAYPQPNPVPSQH